MDTFSIVLVTITLIILAIYYYRQYKKLKKERSKLTWPQEYASCPDYWLDRGKHNCQNIHDLGDLSKCGGIKGENQIVVDMKKKTPGNNLNASNPIVLNKQMNNKKNLISKCKWAKRCNVSWEGVDKLCA